MAGSNSLSAASMMDDDRDNDDDDSDEVDDDDVDDDDEGIEVDQSFFQKFFKLSKTKMDD